MQHAKMNEPCGFGNVREVAFAIVVKQRLWLGPVELRISRSDGDFVEAVVIEVARLRGHAAIPTNDSRFLGDIAERAVTVIAKLQLKLWGDFSARHLGFANFF